MRIRQRFFALFMAAVLLLPVYIAFADETSPDFADGGDTVAEQNNEQTGDGVIEEDETPQDTGDADREQDDNGDDDSAKDEDPTETTGESEKQNGNTEPRSANGRSSDFAGSQEAFEAWVEGHTDENNNFKGGSVTLGANVVLESHILLSGPLHIDTGAYGLTMDGGSVSAGPFSITGEGVGVPVLTIVNIGLRFSAWDNRLPEYNVTARGRGGIGGVAVRVSTDEDGSPGTLESQGNIRSEGAGAVGVEFEYPVKAHFLSVSVTGENSAAISAPDGASLYYCKLKASGQGSKTVAGGDILLDTCAVSGDAGNADVVNRKILALSGNSLYWPLAQGREISDSSLYRTFYYNTVPLYFLLSGGGTHTQEVRWIPVQWDYSAMDKLDVSVIGKTVISGKPYGHYQGLGLEDNFSLDLTIDVKESGQPCITSIKFNGFYDGDNNYVHYVYFQTDDLHEDWFKLEDGNFILWRSDGEEEDWYDFTASPDVSFADGGIMYYYDEITSPAWFCIQEIGGGSSNTAVVYGYEGKTLGSLGGDRTGVDRGGEDPNPAPAPQPESTPGSASSSRKNPSSPSQPILPETAPDTAIQTAAELIPPPSAVSPEQAGELPGADTNNSVPTIPNEWENDTTTAISGRRLRMMMNAGDKVTFIKKRVRLSFDTSALEALEIGDGQLFSVAVEHLGRLEYTVTATLDGTELSDLPCVATLDGSRRNILVSGTYDFAPQADEPDAVQTQTHSDVARPLREQTEPETADSPDGRAEKRSARPAAVFALLGTGCAAGAAVLVRYRVKRYGG